VCVFAAGSGFRAVSGPDRPGVRRDSHLPQGRAARPWRTIRKLSGNYPVSEIFWQAIRNNYPVSDKLCRLSTLGVPCGRDLRLIDSCITQLKAQGPSRTRNESQEEKEGTCCQASSSKARMPTPTCADSCSAPANRTTTSVSASSCRRVRENVCVRECV